MAKLSVRRVENAKPGRHIDGDGLMLVVKASGGRSWIVRAQYQGRRRDFGIGGYPIVSLASARELAMDLRRQIRKGVDPAASRRQAKAIPDLAEALDMWIAKEAPHWRGGIEGHTATVTPRLFERHLPTLMRTKVTSIDEALILSGLMNVWHERRETAKKLFDRLRGTMLLAKASGFAKPIDWDEIRAALPSGKVKTVHHAAMRLQDVPTFANWLKNKDTTAARALLLTILTAVRSGELRGAEWEEMDFSEALWTIPGTRTKTGEKHEVPLAPAAIDLLKMVSAEKKLNHADNAYCFPGPTTGRPLSDVAVSKLLREAGFTNATVHGFRSCFRDWTSEIAEVDREIAEACLAHAPIGGKTEAAYRRATMLRRRRIVMADWAEFVLASGSKDMDPS